MSLRLFALTFLAMCAFAANSVLGRLGLIEGGIGAGSFALIRLLSGALALMLIAGPGQSFRAGSWTGAATLLVYAAFFSFAYIALPAGTGALILFATVQITMIGAGLSAGERLGPQQWSGVIIAMMALIWLLSPGLDTPPFLAALAMFIAGLGWGAYSLIGRTSTAISASPTARTAGNFLRASLLASLILPLFIVYQSEPVPQLQGILYAVISGAITSGLGYAIWYMALPSLSATRAGIAQLSVPALAAVGGVIVLHEPISLRFTLATLLILFGVALATVIRPQQKTD